MPRERNDAIVDGDSDCCRIDTRLKLKLREDIVAAARHLKSLGSTSVGALGISLGGSSVLCASHQPGAEDALDGGILSVAAPADTRKAAERLSRRLPPTHRAYLVNRLFAAMLRSRVRAGRWPEEIDTLVSALGKVREVFG